MYMHGFLTELLENRNRELLGAELKIAAYLYSRMLRGRKRAVEITIPALAAAIGMSQRQTQAALQKLVRKNLLAEFGAAPSAEEIDENRRDMFRAFGESF